MFDETKDKTHQTHNRGVHVIKKKMYKEKQLRWIGYVGRMKRTRLPHSAINWSASGIRPIGRNPKEMD